MTINGQIIDKTIQYNINKEAAKISALTSGKIRKYEYLTGKEILPSNQQQIIEQAKFTYSPSGKAFEKQIKTIEDQGEKQAEALKDLKLKAIEDKSNNNHNQSIISNILNDLIKKRQSIMNELHESTDKNKLYFEYVGPTKNVNFYEHYDSKALFSEIKNNRLRLDEAVKNQKELLKKINEVKMSRKTPEQEEVIDNLDKFYNSREEVITIMVK